jgi:hypothetical protein
MNDYLGISSPRRQLGLYIFLLVAGLVLAFGISLSILLAAGGFKGAGAGIGLDHPGSIALLKFLQCVSTVAIFLVPAWLFSFYVFRDRPFYHLGFRKASGISFGWMAEPIEPGHRAAGLDDRPGKSGGPTDHRFFENEFHDGRPGKFICYRFAAGHL